MQTEKNYVQLEAAITGQPLHMAGGQVIVWLKLGNSQDASVPVFVTSGLLAAINPDALVAGQVVRVTGRLSSFGLKSGHIVEIKADTFKLVASPLQPRSYSLAASESEAVGGA